MITSLIASVILFTLCSPITASPETRANDYQEIKTEQNSIVESKVDLYNYYVNIVCLRYDNLDPDLVKSVIWVESRYVPTAINYNGTCVGLMQLSTKWHTGRANSLGVEDLFDPYGNILTGCDLLSELISKYDGNVANALMAYNMGCSGASKLISQSKVSSYAIAVLSRQQSLKGA